MNDTRTAYKADEPVRAPVYPPSPPPRLLARSLVRSLPSPSFVMNPLNIYIVRKLDAQPPQQNTLMILMTVPWCFKLVYGFLSDICPIGGLRRKPYLAFGYLLSSLCYFGLVLTPEVWVWRGMWDMVGWDDLALC